MNEELRSQAASVLCLRATELNRRIDVSLGTIHGIGFTEYMVLDALALAPSDAMRRTDLAAALCRSASGITRILKPMEKIGLVGKESNQRDARVSLVKLTKAGARMHREAGATLTRSSDQLLEKLSDSAVEGLLKSLNKLPGA